MLRVFVFVHTCCHLLQCKHVRSADHDWRGCTSQHPASTRRCRRRVSYNIFFFVIQIQQMAGISKRQSATGLCKAARPSTWRQRVCISARAWHQKHVCHQLTSIDVTTSICTLIADLLMDFADVIDVNVFTLGATFLKLTHTLNIPLPIIGDPSCQWTALS